MAERERFGRRRILKWGAAIGLGGAGVVKTTDILSERAGKRFGNSAADTVESRAENLDFAKQQIAEFKKQASDEDLQQFFGQLFYDNKIDLESMVDILRDPEYYAQGKHKKTENGSSDISCIAEGAPEPEEK